MQVFLFLFYHLPAHLKNTQKLQLMQAIKTAVIIRFFFLSFHLISCKFFFLIQYMLWQQQSQKLLFEITLHGFLLWASLGFLMPVGILVIRMSNREECGRRVKILFYVHAILQASFSLSFSSCCNIMYIFHMLRLLTILRFGFNCFLKFFFLHAPVLRLVMMVKGTLK